MPLSFPSSPTVNQTVTINSRQYRWTGSVWEFVSSGGGSDSRWDLFLPPAPTGLTATAGNAQVALTWTAPTVLAQTPITDYQIQFQPSGGAWTPFSDGTSATASATVTGLTNGTAYTFRVRAVNGVGEGAWSTASGSVTPGDVFRAIPTMTSNTAPSGAVSGSSSFDLQTMALWRAFDGLTNLSPEYGNVAILGRSPGNSPPRYIQYAFPDGQKSRISGYSITTSYTNLDQWKLFGSDDLSNWTLLDSRSGISAWGTPQQTRTFSLSQPATYRAFRWVLQDVSDYGDSIVIAEISLDA